MGLSASLLLTACLAASTEALAPPPPDPLAAEKPPAPAHALKVSLPIDGAVAGAGTTLWVLSETVFKQALAPEPCRWCDRTETGEDTLNPIDRAARAARWSLQAQHTAATLSDINAFGVLPVSIIALDLLLAHDAGKIALGAEDLVIIAEAVALAAVLNQSVKFLVGRERPFVHALPPQERLLTERPSDNNLSFYSGHSSFVFSMAVAAGTVAERRGYKKAWLIWAVGLPLAATTAYLRMGADKHYLIDVLVGGAVGSAFGLGVPLLFHPRIDPGATAPSAEVSVVPTGRGAALVGRF